MFSWFCAGYGGFIVIFFFIASFPFGKLLCVVFPELANVYSDYLIFIQLMFVGVMTFIAGMNLNYKISDDDLYNTPKESIINDMKNKQKYKKVKTNEHKFCFIPIQYLGALLIIGGIINIISLFVRSYT